MSISDFIGAYQFIDQPRSLNPKYDQTLQKSIYCKKEFRELELSAKGSPPHKNTKLLKHQMNAARIMSSEAPYDKMLFFQGVGSGKTREIIGIIESLTKSGNYDETALVVLKNKSLKKAFISELMEHNSYEYGHDYERKEREKKIEEMMTSGELEKELETGVEIKSDSEEDFDYGLLSDSEEEDFGFDIEDDKEDEEIPDSDRKGGRMSKNIAKRFEFTTYATLYTEYYSNDLNSDKWKRFIDKYSNKVIAIDEVHNIRKRNITGDKQDLYKFYRNMLKQVKNCKIILLSATPMRDSPKELINTMNMINDNEINASTFIKNFYDTSGERAVIFPSKKEELFNYFNGRVIYLKIPNIPVEKEFMKYGNQSETTNFKLFESEMIGLQKEVYLETCVKGEGGGFQKNRVQSSLFVFPDKSYGAEGFGKYFVKSNGQNYATWRNNNPDKKPNYMKDFSLVSNPNSKLDIVGGMKRMSSDLEKIQKIKQYSAKYASIFKDIIIDNKEGCVFIFCRVVKGGGAIVFAKLLEQVFGYKQYTGESVGVSSAAPRYALLTGEIASPSEIFNTVLTFNHPRNYDGKYIRIIIGSKVIGEGISLYHTVRAHMVVPFWNFAFTDQALGRIFRLNSYVELEKYEKNIKVEIFLHVATLGKDGKSVENLESKEEVEGLLEEHIENGNEDDEVNDDNTGDVEIANMISKNDHGSVDIRMYLYSEGKDILIKALERIAKVSALDCRLTKARNTLGKDFSRDCEYQSCDYECYSIPNEEKCEKIDESTYNIYYSNEEIENISNVVKELFNITNIMNLGEIISVSSLSNHSDFMIVQTLHRMIDSSYPITNSYGMISYLREKNDIYFLTSDINSLNTPLSSYYVKNPATLSEISMVDVVKIAGINNFNKLLEKMGTLPDSVNIYEKIISPMIDHIPIKFKEILVQVAIYGSKNNNNPREIFCKWIINRFKNYIFNIDGKIVSAVSYPINNLLYCYNEKETRWTICQEYKSIVDEKLPSKSNIDTQKYGFYFIDRKYMSEESDKFAIAGHAKSTVAGAACNNKNKQDIISLLVKLNIRDTNDDEKEDVNEDPNDNKVITRKNELIESIITANANYSNLDKLTKKYFKKKKKEELTIKQLSLFLYYITTTYKRETLCKILENGVKDNHDEILITMDHNPYKAGLKG
jgi:hypothetical protein